MHGIIVRAGYRERRRHLYVTWNYGWRSTQIRQADADRDRNQSLASTILRRRPQHQILSERSTISNQYEN